VTAPVVQALLVARAQGESVPDARTWPFWRSNLAREVWEGAVKARCPGIGAGPLHSREAIEREAARTERDFTA
jgi:hypothetical protein